MHISKRPQFLTVTPQDLTSFKQSLDGRKLSPNYRFRGYPVGSFEKPRDPLHVPVINPKDLTTDADVKYARPHYFDPRKLRGFRKVAVYVCLTKLHVFVKWFDGNVYGVLRKEIYNCCT